jgi:ornithine cyclodeaminase/alanine dehydrogenase-like protein (mu-crystallin family)
MTNIQKNIATELQNLALVVLQLKPRLEAIVEMYNTAEMANLTNDDYALLADFVGITIDDMYWAKTAYSELAIAIGGFVGNENAERLLKILNRVP